MNRPHSTLGRAVRQLAERNTSAGQDWTEASVLRRFNALATAEEITEISHHLRGMVQMLSAAKDGAIPLDYPQLAVDLYELQCTDPRYTQIPANVRLRWGQDLYFMSTAQAKALAALAVAGSTDKKEYQKALRAAPSMDMALFGRMVADDPSLKYNAAAQVAHSISTHAVKNEYDYFTAVDDCQTDSTGAGHLGTVEYNSSTLYRYATVNVLELAEQLGAEQAAETVRAFGEAFLFSMPTGRQNSFANRTLPDAVYVTLREDQPVNLCGAFERAVSRGEQGGYAEASKAALAQYAQQVYASFVESPAQSFTVGGGLEALAPAQTAKAMLDALEKAVRDALSGNEVE